MLFLIIAVYEVDLLPYLRYCPIWS